MRLFTFILSLTLVALAHGAAYTSTQNGPWSAQATWGGSGPPAAGDTATIAHTVNVDVNTSVGTSPNDNTTAAVTVNGSRSLVVTNGVTLTLLGNYVWGGSSASLTLLAGSHLVFDASSSGGTPTYRFSGANTYTLNSNGTAVNRCSISAISGRVFTIGSAINSPTFTYTDFNRSTNTSINCFSGTAVFDDCKWDSCSEFTFTIQPTVSISITDCIWTNSVVTATTGSARLLDGTGVYSSGTRIFARNILESSLTYNATSVQMLTNYIGKGIAGVTTWLTCRNNLLGNRGDLQTLDSSVERCYVVGINTGGNPHFILPRALGAADTTVSQCIFESQSPDLTDLGDAALLKDASVAAGRKILGKNNIVLPSGYSGAVVASGAMLTLYNASTNVVTEWTRNTANLDTGTHPNGKEGMFDFAEANDGSAGQIPVLKSNLGWGSAADQNYLAHRVTGSVQDIITASGSDYNWLYNASAGDNLRGYDSRVGSGDLWATGNAVAAGVDNNQGSGDPQFYDSARNMAKWCYDRGYGTQTYTNAVTVIQNDLSKIPDLINYVFEGYRPANASTRNAAHDGGCVGAANFYKSTRTLGALNAYRSTLSAFGL